VKTLGVVLSLLALQASAAGLTRGPYLQLADSTAITVVFRTDVPSIGTVRFGSGQLTWTVSDFVPSVEHVLRLTGLSPSTRYRYEVAVDGVTVAGGDSFRFRTHPPPGTAAPFRLFAWGDSGNGGVTQLSVAERLANEVGDATLSLILGDIIYDLGQAELYDDRFFAPYAPLLRRMVVWPTIGNHDVGADPLGGPYLDAFTLPTNNPASTELYYSFDYGDAHFVCLDTHVSGHAAGSAQLQWAAADLAASSAKWKFVFFHVPPWTGGTHPDDPGVIAGIVPMVEAAGVDVVFSGHSHVYERTYLLKDNAVAQADPRSYVKTSADAGTLYLVSGSGGQSGGLAVPAHPFMAFQFGFLVGASVIDVSGDTLHGYFLRDDGTAIDLFRLSKGPDTQAPRIIAARALTANEVEFSFDEPVLAGSGDGGAERLLAYSISPPVALISARLAGDARTVRLVTAGHPPGSFSISASEVDDGSGNRSSGAERTPYEVRPSIVLGGGTVKYFVPSGVAPRDWQRVNFDDSSWDAGVQPIGYGSSALVTDVELGNQVTLYTRAHFTPGVELGRVRELTLEIDYDDGFVAFLNGVEIARQNVLAGQGSGTAAGASRERGLLEHRLIAAPPEALLVAGDNVLAIEVHNVAASSSDLFLTARLRGVLDQVQLIDAGVVDAGVFDAGIVDAGVVEIEVDAGNEPSPVPTGCSCRSSEGFGALCLLGLWRRRRVIPSP
jgi:3',5'-cyclic AMP phosphodiesterase CpdA